MTELDITPLIYSIFVKRYGYTPGDEQRDKTRLREIELTIKAQRELKQR